MFFFLDCSILIFSCLYSWIKKLLSLPAASSWSGSLRNRDSCIQFLFNGGHAQMHKEHIYMWLFYLSADVCFDNKNLNSMRGKSSKFNLKLRALMQSFGVPSLFPSVSSRLSFFSFCPHMQFCHHCPQWGDTVSVREEKEQMCWCGHAGVRTLVGPQVWQWYPKCMHSHMQTLTAALTLDLYSSCLKWPHFTFLHFIIRFPKSTLNWNLYV